MADGEQNFVVNEDEQPFTIEETPDFDDQQNTFAATMTGEYNFAGEDETVGDPSLENFPVTENTFQVVSEETYPENDEAEEVTELHIDQEVEDASLLQGLVESEEMKGPEEFVETEGNEGDVVVEGDGDADADAQEGSVKKENSVAPEKKWPGWPGESVFRMLVPAQKVGNIIGRKGEYIKKIVEETRARIKVLDGPPGSQERAVMVSGKEEPDASLPPAMEGLLRVHRRIVDGLDSESSQAVPAGSKVSTRLLVPATQAGSLIGKQGATVKQIQETSSCIVRVLGQEDLPVFALQDDRVVEVVGEPANVHTAIELIASHLRKFLVDRSIIPVFEKQMQAPSNPMEHMPPQPWGPPHGLPPNAGGGHGYASGPQYMPPPPRQLDSYYPPADMAPPPDRQPHQGISAYGREPPMSAHTSTAQPAQSMITQVTQHMQIPLLYADSVIGTNGATISYIRRLSGATVTIQETRGVPTEMTVEINGTASQVQTAQQLIQNFMAEAATAAGAAAPAQTQTGATTEQAYSQGYSSYAAPGSMYTSPPTSGGHASQPGAYGSVYGASYGY